MKLQIQIFVLCIVFGSTACFSSSRIHHESSVGQQLMDLKKSHEDGIINDEEFERLKKAIIKKKR